MEDKKTTIEYVFTTAKEAAKHYSVATGIPCFVIDARGTAIGGSDIFHSCSVCQQIYGEKPGKELCQKTHLYGSYQSERFGGRYHYFCPASLNYWASPIMFDGVMQGAFIAGPVLLIDQEELVYDILRIKQGLQDQTSQYKQNEPDHPGESEESSELNFNTVEDKIRIIIEHFPRISPSRAHSLSELLFHIASSVSDNTIFILREKVDVLQQQSRISEYIHHIKTMEGQEPSDIAYPIEKERELLQLISTGDKKNAKAVLNELLGSVFFSTGSDFVRVKSRVLELVVLLSRAALEGGADIEQIFGLNYAYLSEVHSYRNIHDLANWLSRILDRFTDLVFDLQEIKHTDAIYKAIQFIYKYYYRRLSLEEVSSEVYLSPPYFSKIFRHEVGITFKTYLNKVRIEKSKVLLRNRNIQLIDVAGMVGYEDQSYFTKVFKRFVGLSPGKYRDSWGHFPSNNQEIH